MEIWENLQARLYHLAYLGEEMPEFVATPGGSWLFRQILAEAGQVAAIAAAYLAECERDPMTGAVIGGTPDDADDDTADDAAHGIVAAAAACGVEVITESGDDL